MKFLVIAATLPFFLLTISRAEEVRGRFYARSHYHLTLLERLEIPIALKLSLAVSQLPSNSTERKITEAYLRDYKDSRNVSRLADNPICAYRLLRRVTHYFRYMAETELLAPFLKPARDYFRDEYWPSQGDIDDALDGILRLHLFHDFNIEQFADGIIEGEETGCRLNSAHCYELAVWAGKSHQWAQGVEWLQLATSRAIMDGKTDYPLLESTMATAIEAHNAAFDASHGWEPELFDGKLEYKGRKNYGKRRNELLNAFWRDRGPNYHSFSFWGLCSGQNSQTEREKSALFCWLEHKTHPSFLIAPVKMELLALNPDVVHMYDVLTDEEIQQVLEKSERHMNASEVVNRESPSSVLSNVRTSVTTWELGSAGDPIRALLSKKMERLTGLHALSPTSAEEFQLSSYTFVGHYSPHLDAFQSDSLTSTTGGERIATVLIYLRDAEKGGYTSFNSLGTFAKPIKGSAIFWFGILSDGSDDEGTYHGACPVLLGTKFVVNKWIRLHDQFLVQKCGLHPKQRFRVRVNGKKPKNKFKKRIRT